VIRQLDKAVERNVCEHMLHAYAKLYGFRAVALRYANVVGPRLRHGAVWALIKKLRKNPMSWGSSATANKSGATSTSTTPWRPPSWP
jgi:nucleoside-diphosphate-sugar epimerase